MPLSPAAAHVAQLSATDLYKGIHREKGFSAPETHGIGGVILKICKGVGDSLAGDKVAAIRMAIYKLSQLNVPMPAEMTIYTSASTTFMNVAFQRALDGSQKAVICLGGKLDNPLSLPVGIATMVGGANKQKYITAVCVHEIGHLLNEIVDPEWFWSADANTLPDIPMSAQLSMYAGNNKKEFVAEAFTARVFQGELGLVLSDPLKAYYRTLHGPTAPGFMV